MAFSFYSPPSLTPAQSGAMPDIIGNILRGYSGAVNAKYLPKEKESKIFANQIGASCYFSYVAYVSAKSTISTSIE